MGERQQTYNLPMTLENSRSPGRLGTSGPGIRQRCANIARRNSSSVVAVRLQLAFSQASEIIPICHPCFVEGSLAVVINCMIPV